MSASHHYWVLPDTDAAIGAAMRAAGPGIVPGGLATGQGAAGNLALAKVRAEAAGTAPAGVTEMDLDVWQVYSVNAAWTPFSPGTAWLGTERAVLVDEATATAAQVAHLPGGWACCERLPDGRRLVRYTGPKPAALVGATFYAAEVAAIVGSL